MMISERGMSVLKVSAVSAMLAACSYMSVGQTCSPDGRCVPAVIFSGVICPNGDPAPSAADCATSPPQFSPQDMAGLELLFDAVNGITYDNTVGNVEIAIGGGPTLNAQWVVNNGKIVLSTPESVGNWIVTNTPGTQTYPIEFNFEDVAIRAPGTSANQIVQITTTAKFEGTTIESETDQYVYYPPPPQASINVEQMGGSYCNWLVTSMQSHPAYTLAIERQNVLGGNWTQTYSGADTCIPRSGAYVYRGVYKDIFGNRGPNSAYWVSNCNGNPPG